MPSPALAAVTSGLCALTLLACEPAPTGPSTATPDPEAPHATPSEAPPSLHLGPSEELPTARALIGVDFDGDGSDELVRVHEGTVHGPWGSSPLQGSWQGATAGVLGTAEGETLVLATGMGRDDRTAPARVFLSTGDEPVIAWESSGERNQVSDLRIVDGRLWLASFTDTWNVAGGWLEDGSLAATTSSRLALAQLPRPDGSVLLGRLYGDEPKSDGMLLLQAADGTQRTLPSLRGPRALTAADLDGDGQDELLMGDGWHYQYGDRGVGRVQLLEGPDWTRSRTIAMLPGSYSVEHLELESLGDGRPVVLASGSSGAAVLVPDALGWALHEVGPLTDGSRARFERRGAELAVLLPGTPSRRVPLRTRPAEPTP